MFEEVMTRIKDRFCPQDQRKSFSLGQLDLKLEPYLRGRGGYFIEAGANNGLRQSNTLYFEKYLGWRGLLIEAIPALAEACRKNRTRCIVENYALVSDEYTSPTVEMDYLNLMSQVKGCLPTAETEARHLAKGLESLRKGDTRYTITVPATTLGHILDRHRISHIDLLSLDVEGYEPEVLKGLDFNRHRPAWLLLEVRDRPLIEQIILPFYQQTAILGENESYADILYSARSG
jgi:FkbM family methyltransferase